MKNLLPLLFLASVALAEPNVAQWESNMKTYGQRHCATLKTYSGFDASGQPKGLNDTYYDAEAIYYQIADYTRDTSWHTCAATAERIYRTDYVEKNGGSVPGYWNFSGGLLTDFLKTGDATSKQATLLLSTKGAWCAASTYNDQRLVNWYQSRENAYCLMAHINSYKAGNAQSPQIAKLLGFALGHMQQWFVTRPAGLNDALQSQPFYVKPFMTALTAQALIEYQDKIAADSRIPAALKLAADGLNPYWVSASNSWKYISTAVSGEDPPNPAPDLNLLIAPLYARVYRETGNQAYADRFDAAWNRGVDAAFLTGAKQFNQSYRWSRDGLKWRTVTSSPLPSPSPTMPLPCASWDCANKKLDDHEKRLRVLEGR